MVYEQQQWFRWATTIRFAHTTWSDILRTNEELSVDLGEPFELSKEHKGAFVSKAKCTIRFCSTQHSPRSPLWLASESWNPSRLTSKQQIFSHGYTARVLLQGKPGHELDVHEVRLIERCLTRNLSAHPIIEPTMGCFTSKQRNTLINDDDVSTTNSTTNPTTNSTTNATGAARAETSPKKNKHATARVQFSGDTKKQTQSKPDANTPARPALRSLRSRRRLSIEGATTANREVASGVSQMLEDISKKINLMKQLLREVGAQSKKSDERKTNVAHSSNKNSTTRVQTVVEISSETRRLLTRLEERLEAATLFAPRIMNVPFQPPPPSTPPDDLEQDAMPEGTYEQSPERQLFTQNAPTRKLFTQSM